MGFVLGSFDSGAEKEAVPVAPAAEKEAVPEPVQPQPGSSLPNWMPAPVVNGANNVAPMPTPTPARVTRSGATAGSGGVSNGVAFGSRSAPKKRGRPRKYPLQS